MLPPWRMQRFLEISPHFSFYNYFSGITAKNLKNFLKDFYQACYSSICHLFFFYCFFPFFGIPEAAGAALTETDSTAFRQLALLFLCDGESQKQNNAKNAYARVIM